MRIKKINYAYFPEGKPLALTMSYDDGQAYDLRLVEIFNKYGIRGTFHLNSGGVNKPGYLTDGDVRAISERHEISCHSVNHPYLDKIPAENALREIMADREALEAITGGIIRGMSYPFGTYTQELIPLLRTVGMEYSRTVEATGGFHLPGEFMLWHPTAHHNDGITALWERFQPGNTGRLMYVWGHSYEFPRDNNWDLIEDFCKTAGNRENVWYAANIEIVDYVNALRGLRFSAGAGKVFNSAACPVWIGVDGECVMVPAGTVCDL